MVCVALNFVFLEFILFQSDCTMLTDITDRVRLGFFFEKCFCSAFFFFFCKTFQCDLFLYILQNLSLKCCKIVSSFSTNITFYIYTTATLLVIELGKIVHLPMCTLSN